MAETEQDAKGRAWIEYLTVRDRVTDPDTRAFAFGWHGGRDYQAALQRPVPPGESGEVGRLRELIDAIVAYDVGRYEAGKEGRIGRLLEAYQDGGFGPNKHWQPDAIRVWKALSALAAQDGARGEQGR